MKIACILLACCLSGWLALADSTNLLEVLRATIRELDEREQAARKGAEAGGLPPAAGAAAVRTNAGGATRLQGGLTEQRGLLATGDVVRVTIEDEPELCVDRGAVGEDGSVRMPLLGPVRAVGKTPGQLGEEIRRLLEKDYLVDPRVRVVVLERSTCTFVVRQQVLKPGTYTWRSGETMTLVRAIGLAGGATRSAALSRVTVTRVVDGRRTVFLVDLGPESLRRNPEVGSFALQPGDEIEVPRR